MKAWLAVLVLTLALAGCSEDGRAIRSAQAAVTATLKDPPSARFGEAFVIRRAPDKGGVVSMATCGVVDGRNGFGGYTGGSRYVVQQVGGGGRVINADVEVDKGGTEAMWGQDTSFDHYFWNPNCVDAAHPATHSARAY